MQRATTSDCRGNISVSGASCAEASKQVFAKGVFDLVLGSLLIISPYAMKYGLGSIHDWESVGNVIIFRDSSLQLLLGAITLGSGYSAVKASYTDCDQAYQLVATFSVVQAIAILIGFWSYPESPHSTLLLMVAAENLIWFMLITMLGDYGMYDTLGFRMSSKIQQRETHRQDLKTHIEDVLVRHEDPDIYREALRLGL